MLFLKESRVAPFLWHACDPYPTHCSSPQLSALETLSASESLVAKASACQVKHTSVGGALAQSVRVVGAPLQLIMPTGQRQESMT